MLDANSPGGVKFMPLYFFDFMDGEFNGRDKFGTKLPDVEDAALNGAAEQCPLLGEQRKTFALIEVFRF